jgi:uncharacterized membrane protein YkvA (DUF1232 family)
MTQKKYQPDPEKINEAVEKSKSKAEDYLKDPEKSKHLLDEAVKKAKDKEKISGPLAELWENLKTVIRLLQAYFNKQYTAIPWGSIVLLVGAIIYFVSPLDLMPDWIPMTGFIDDAAVLVFVLRQINADLQRFLEWEAEQNSASSKQVIDIKLEQKQ